MTDSKWMKILGIVLLVLLAVLYGGFHNQYRVEYVDDAWTLSWAYNWWTEKDVYDPFFGRLDGDGGTALFSRTFAFVYGAAGQLWGWSRPLHYGVSTFFVLLTAALWFFIGQKLGYQKKLMIWFVLLFLYLEAFFGMGHKIRVEALTMALASGAFLLYLNGRLFWAAFLGMAAFENHPYGVSAFLWMLTALAARPPYWVKDKRIFLRKAGGFLLGMILGGGYYLLLHYPYLAGFTNLGARIHGNVLYSYYFKQRLAWRHLHELAGAAAALFLFLLKKGWRKDRFLLPFLGVSVLLTFLLPRGNYHYIVYVYPGLLLLVLTALEGYSWKPALLAFLILFQGMQYAYLFWSQRDFNWSRYQEDLVRTVPQDTPMILGPSGGWFAFKEHNFRYYGYLDWGWESPGELPSEFILVSTPEFRNGRLEKLKNLLGESFLPPVFVDEIAYFQDNTVEIWRYRRSP